MSMTTNHMKPVKAWAFKDLVGDVFASTNKEEVGCAFHHSGSPSEVRPVTIQSAEWLTREAFEAGADNNKRVPCWVNDKKWRTWFGFYENGRYRLTCLDSGETCDTGGSFVDEVLPIHPLQAPSED